MTAHNQDPTVRWHSIRDFYDEFSRTNGWEFLKPMVFLTEWVADQPWAEGLYPNTSHEWLCVKLVPGYDSDVPFFACVARPDGQFECDLLSRVGRSLERRTFPVNEARSAFWNFVQRLNSAI